MTKRIILGGLAGGVVLFIWGSIAWMVLPLHNASVKTLPNEDAVRIALLATVNDPGFYYFPNYPHDAKMTADEQTAAMHAFEEKHKAGPLGILVYQSQGAETMEPRTFATGFVIGLLAATLVAWMLSKAAVGLNSYGGRVQFVTMVGALAALVVDIPYWNWFRFPLDYTIGMVADHVIGWFLVGLAMAAVVKRQG